jgi:hypothetical protein
MSELGDHHLLCFKHRKVEYVRQLTTVRTRNIKILNNLDNKVLGELGPKDPDVHCRTRKVGNADNLRNISSFQYDFWHRSYVNIGMKY